MRLFIGCPPHIATTHLTLHAMAQAEELLKRPLYGRVSCSAACTLYPLTHIVYDLPEPLLSTLVLKGGEHKLPAISKEKPLVVPHSQTTDGDSSNATFCSLCGDTSKTVAGQRAHVKSDLHRFNLKRRIRGEPAVQEKEFEKLLDGNIL